MMRVFSAQRSLWQYALLKVDALQLWVRAVDVLCKGVLGVLGHLADGALVGDACHDVALLGVAPHACPAADELAARPAHEPAGRRHHVAVHEGGHVARRERPRLAGGGRCKESRLTSSFTSQRNCTATPTPSHKIQSRGGKKTFKLFNDGSSESAYTGWPVRWT